MTPLEAIETCFRKFADFTGRATRPEYWWWTAFVLAGSLLTAIVPILNTVFSLAVLVPGVAVAARRLHDVDRSGWFMLLPLSAVPVIVLGRVIQGGILVPVGGMMALGLGVLVLVWYCTDGTPGPNRFGPDPKGRRGPLA